MGTEFLTVLYISGDFTTVNAVDQTNILGDVDQLVIVQAAMEAAADLQATLGDSNRTQVEVVTGSNAQANIATVQEFGIDSTVMAGGEQYSDALIYQADLIDMDAIPNGVDIAALATEAVAFLADGLIDAETLATGIITSTDVMIDTAGQVDVMQSVLA